MAQEPAAVSDARMNGCGFYGWNDGDVGYYTYRDPKPGRRYTELLHTTPEDLLSWFPALDAISAQPTACVIAGAELLNSCADAITSRLRGCCSCNGLIPFGRQL